MPRGNPNLKNMTHKGRAPKSNEKFYFILPHDIRITKDKYNLILAKIHTSENGTKKRNDIGFYSSIKNDWKELKPHTTTVNSLYIHQKTSHTIKEMTSS